ncbi:uncharacterized protein LOC134455138 [Engraulis encrasicolus]|uniref:uncharacterized protein LOC134455138 n=1 Tax=Engraulis encrasicolus TaxID=184585 RepID=UPI002FD037ED
MDEWSKFIDLLIPIISASLLMVLPFYLHKRSDSVLDHSPESCNPEVHSSWFYVIWTTVSVTDTVGLFLSDRGYILQAFWLKLLCVVVTFCMLFYSYISVQRHRALLYITKETRSIYCLLQNGVALSAWWSLLRALVSLGVVMKYGVGLRDPLVSTIVLSLLLLVMLIWFLLENSVWVQYIHYNFAVYPIIILGLGSIFTRGYQAADMAPNTVYCGCLMLVATLMNCVFLFRLCCDPKHSADEAYILPSPRRPEDCPTVCLALEKKATEGKWNQL